MRRREFLGVLAGGVVACPMLARAQKAMPVIGTLYGVSVHAWTNNMAGFRCGLGLVCQKEFETIDRRLAIDRGAEQQQTAAELEEPFLSGLLAA
jgi:hypothetical protein